MTFTNKFKFKGGFKKRNPFLNNFEPIKEMMQCPGTRFKLITDKSLMGFIFSMSLTDSDCYQHLNIGDDGSNLENSPNTSAFYKPVNEYLLKFSLVNSRPDDDEEKELDQYVSKSDGDIRNKMTDTQTNFLNEAKIQQEVWMKSTLFGKKPVCPSVANVALFNAENSQKLLNHMLMRMDVKDQKEEEWFKQIIDVMKTYVQEPSYNMKLGLITMEFISQPMPYDPYMELLSKESDKAKKEKMRTDNSETEYDKNMKKTIINATAQVLRLFLYKYIHLDLHGYNMLVSKNDDVYIIDFGRAINVTNTLKSKYEDFVNRIALYETQSNSVKEHIVKSTIELIENVDKRWIQMQTDDYSRGPQMELLVYDLRRYDKLSGNELYVKIYDKVISLLNDPERPFNEKQIEDLYKTGEFEKITHYSEGLNVNQYHATDNGSVVVSETNNITRSQQGGKRRRTRLNKVNKKKTYKITASKRFLKSKLKKTMHNKTKRKH